MFQSVEDAFIAAMLVAIASDDRATIISGATDLIEGILLTMSVEVVICLLIKSVEGSRFPDVFTISETG